MTEEHSPASAECRHAVRKPLLTLWSHSEGRPREASVTCRKPLVMWTDQLPAVTTVTTMTLLCLAPCPAGSHGCSMCGVYVLNLRTVSCAVLGTTTYSCHYSRGHHCAHLAVCWVGGGGGGCNGGTRLGHGGLGHLHSSKPRR